MMRYILLAILIAQTSAFSIGSYDMSSLFGKLEDNAGSLRDEISKGITNLHHMWTGNASATDDSMVLVSEEASSPVNKMENGFNITIKETRMVFARPNIKEIEEETVTEPPTESPEEKKEEQELEDDIAGFLEGINGDQEETEEDKEVEEIAEAVEEKVEEDVEEKVETVIEQLPRTVTLVRTEMTYTGHNITGKAQSVHVISDYGANLKDLPPLPEINILP